MNVILKRPARPVFHPIRAACGYGAAQFMLSFVGGELKATVPRSTLEAMSGPPLWPADMARLLTRSGHPAHVHWFQSMTDGSRLDFISEQLRKGKPVAILGRVYILSLHWLVVCGQQGADMLVYDPRKKYGGSSVRQGLPVGNRKIPAEELFGLWWGSVPFPKHRYKAVAFT